MRRENLNQMKLKEMEKELGCKFCDSGIFAEMSLDLLHYQEKTAPIPDVRFTFCNGSIDEIREAVAKVDDGWVQFFDDPADVFCGYCGGRIVSFCIVDTDADCILSRNGIRIGSIGCVGTVPEMRGRGIGLRMVDLATLYLGSQGCDKSYIHYTHIDSWYQRLGYETFARFDL